MIAFVRETLVPTLLAPETHADVIRIQYADLAGIVPGVGTFNPCPWGLGVEIRGVKTPHWTGRANSAATFGHFGGAGTMMWTDPNAGMGLVALTDRPFDEWRDEALARWPELSDAALAEHRSGR
jgi:CubicO group peptidase (beta-lactamase class C family)